MFPIGFDLEKGIKEAEKNADVYLRRLENTLRQKPIRLDVAIDRAAPGSLDAIRNRMDEVVKEFNKLTEAQRIYNRTSGEFTPEAQKLIKEYAELTAATQTYAQSLSQITNAAKRQTEQQIKAQQQEIKRYEEYWKRKEAENAKQAQQDIANAERSRKAQQQRITQEQAADAKRYQEWLRQKNQEAVETERVERQKQQSRERTIAQQNREYAAQRQAEAQRQQAISASLRAEYQRIEAKRQAELASRRELQQLNQMYAAEERRHRLAASQASIAQRQKVLSVLRAEENTIVNITAKLQHWQQVMNSYDMGGRQFKRATEEVKRLTAELEKAQARVANATATASSRQSAAVRQVNQEFRNQEGYISRLIKRTAAYWSFNQVSTFLTRVRDVTAEFELQRVSLGAIIQDQQKANQLFGEIKSFALKSPLKILDLTKYTKQVAAYRIETDKLFDTTKRLADVSVGLGVDMGRLVLAYGQVKAASYLRAAEIRQFTEAGIPLLELLAEKFTELQGSAVSTEEVMDKVSRRMVSFSMVEEIFKDMTDAGGMFYNMQEKQSQTLYGMWAKMGDAAAVMYDQIGNTATVNSGMKYLIQLLQDSMLHWTAFANVLQTGVLGFAAYKAAMAGLVPFYKLNSIQIMASIKAEKAQQSLLLRRTSLYTKLTTAQLRQLVSTKKLTTAEWEEYITKNKLNQISALRLARMSKENAALQKALINQKLYTQAQLQQIQAMSKGQYVWATVKSAVMGVGGAIKSVGAMLKTFWPLAAITAGIDLLMDWRQAVEAQEAAVKKVDKQYEEMKVTLMEIENAYNDIKNASKSATENEEEFAKTSYSQKLEQLKNIMKLLSQFGLKNTIDLSVLNYENIDPVIDNWIKKLNEVNELSQKWGRSVAEVANAYEGNIFGWSIFGENLNEDMKDLSHSWTKLTVNTEFNNSLRQLKAIVGELANENKGVYDQISKAVGMDLKLALAQKRRNESEVQYQQRIYKNYQNIESYLQTFRNKGEYGGMLPSLSAADVADRFGDFKSDLDEVMHEVRKTIAAFENEEPMTIRMAIDQQFTLNEWEEWQKELVIQELNKDRLKAGLDLIPTLSSAATGAVAEGLKAIITSEFPGLFKDEELQSLVSAEGIVEAIKTKLDASNESLEKSVQLQNNLAYGSRGFENSLDRVKKLQQEITDIENMRSELADLDARNGNLTSAELLRRSELQAKLQEVDEASLNTKRAQIAAIVEANAKYDEQIQKQRESAEAEREIAKAALERVSSMGLSDLGKDVKEQFGGLVVDAVKEMTDKNYSTDFLISDEDLKKVRDVGDLYAQWAQNTKAIKDEKEKLVGVGITEATIERERAALEEKRAKIELQLKAIETEISAEKFKGQEAQYATLKLALANATTTDAQKTAQENLNKFLGDTKNAEFAILMLKREGLKTSLQEALVSEAANNQIDAYLKGLDNAEKLWEELGKRYNFRLQETGGNHGGSGEDPWIILMKNRMKFMQDFQKGVEDLSKWMGYTKGLADEQENMLGRGLSLKIDSRKLNGTKDELIAWYEDAIGEVRKRIAKLGGKEWEGLGVQMILAKDTKSRVIKKYQELLQDLFKEMTDFRTEQMQSEMERKLKELADRISRTKTAKEFYEKILDMTGDIQLSANLAVSVYGQNGQDLQDAIREQIKTAFETDPEKNVTIDLSEAIDPDTGAINYNKLAELEEKYKDVLISGRADLRQKLIDEGRKTSAAQVQQWLKDIEKAKDFAQQRIDLATYTANQIAAINARTDLPQADKDKLTKGYQDREAKQLAKLQYDEFKDSAMYVHIFEDLDHASTTALKNMRDRLIALKGQWQHLDPTQVKELTKAIADLDEQIAGRSPFKSILDSFKGLASARPQKVIDAELLTATKELTRREEALTAATKKYTEAQTAQLNAQAEVAQARQDLEDALAVSGGEETAEVKAAREVLGIKIATFNAVKAASKESISAAKTEVDKASEKYEEQKKVIDKLVEEGKIREANIKKIELANQKIDEYQQQINEALDGVRKMMEAFGASDEDMQFFDDVVGALNEIVDAGQQAAMSVASFMSGNIFGGITSGVSAIGGLVSGFTNLFYAGRVKRANKEIKRQQELLDQLEYTYGRLEKAADKLFGADFVANQKQQQKILLAQQQAYMKQYEAEMSKGKKADKEKAQEFLDKARDVGDQIADMQGKIAERMLGTDLTSAARDFANAWLEAYLSFGSTTDAIHEKFQEMVKNMLVESFLAQTVKNALQPVFDMIDERAEDGEISEKDMVDIIQAFNDSEKQMDDGLRVRMEILKKLGFDLDSLRNKDSEFSGIAKSIAGATSEEINQLSAFVNTALYYVSPIPTISENVSLIRQLMERGTTSTLPDTTAAGWTDWQQQAMDNYNAIARNTADTVVECRRAAVACEAATEKLNRALRAKGATIGFNVFLNS